MLTLLMVGDGPDHIDVLESSTSGHLHDDHMLVAVRKTHGTYTNTFLFVIMSDGR